MSPVRTDLRMRTNSGKKNILVTYRAAQLKSELLLIFAIFFLSIKKEENLPAEPLFAVGTNLANEASDGFLTLEHVTKAITCTDQ